MQVILLVELLGQPQGDAYRRLDTMMQDTLGWENKVRGANEAVAPLPRATYAGQTELEPMDLANHLVGQITNDVWEGGARVVVVRWVVWAGAGTA